MVKVSASVHGGAPQQSAAPGVCMPPQPGTVSALGAHAPGPAVRAAVPISSASCAAPQEPRLGTAAPAPPMSYASSTLDAGRHVHALALGDGVAEREEDEAMDGEGEGEDVIERPDVGEVEGGGDGDAPQTASPPPSVESATACASVTA